MLVRTGCSVLGLCSDNAGSVRTPALNCGICAFKFGVERMTTKGMWGLVPEGECPVNICGTEYGIITKCAEDARLASKVIHENELMYQQDPELVHRDWNNEIFDRKEKLKVCYIDQTIDYQISEPNQRALQMSVDCLSAQGHKVDRLTFENFADEVFNSKICLWELGKALAPYLRHDWTINESFSLYQTNLIPSWVLHITAFIFDKLGWAVLQKHTQMISRKNTPQYISSRIAQMDNFRSKFLEKIKPYDALL